VVAGSDEWARREIAVIAAVDAVAGGAVAVAGGGDDGTKSWPPRPCTPWPPQPRTWARTPSASPSATDGSWWEAGRKNTSENT